MRRLEKKKKDIDKELKQDVSSSPFVAITDDGWTSLNTQSFFTTTVHYVNNDWILKSAVLGTIQMTGSQTSQNISEELKATHTKWNLPASPIATTYNPLIKNIARKYLSVPAYSVSSERVFSLCGNLVNKKRYRLSPNNVDLLVFLNRNIGYW